MTVTLCDCGHPPSPHESFTTGYGADAAGKTACYECCAERDRQDMREHGRATLYLVKRENVYHVTNWPSSLDIRADYVKTGRHNIARKRYDVWFTFEGVQWHGVQYGDMTQILHARALKPRKAA